ncbi:hypothetical protein ACQZ46_24550 [Agrobacterium salinitolerans]
MSCLTSGFKAEIATIVGRDYVKEDDAISAIDYLKFGQSVFCQFHAMSYSRLLYNS